MTLADISWVNTNDMLRGSMEGDHARAEVQGGRMAGREGGWERGRLGDRLGGWEEPGRDFPPPWKRPLV